MNMIIHDVQQGSTEWHALRLEHFTASEAPAMLGVSKYQSRSDLLQQKKTGLAPEVDAATQRLFDNGHATEAMARPIVERMIGEDLYPVVGTLGNLLASMDGMTMLGDTLFEHKALNQSLIQQIATGELEAHYWVQLEQQLYVSGAQRVIFVCSDGTEENFHHLEYRPVPGRIEQILAGWKQFEEDLAAYVPAPPKIETVATTIIELPSLAVQLVGEVKQSNLAVYKESALAFIQAIKTDLQSDQDFADAEATVKFCDKAEKELELVKSQALAQTASIDELFRTVDQLKDEMRAKRLMLDKLVKSRKEAIKVEIKQKAENAFSEHVATINKRLGKVQLPTIVADFAGALKNKRTIATLQDAADTELARVKIEANAIAEGIETNLASLCELAANHAYLFTDAQQLVLKDNEALVAIVKGRISEHEAAENDKAEARAEAERERIREEERQRLEQEHKEQADRAAAEQAAKVVAEPPQAQPAAAEPVGNKAYVAQVSEAISLRPTASAAPAQPADDGQRIKLGDINARLGFSLTADFLRSIGIEPVGRDRAAVLYRASDFARICTTLIAHIGSLEQRIAA